ncbi:MAG: hypothetical protein GX224_01390 [Thermoplasmatales archaeon]|nr:hypothetical protein [Thermoplasmatales archaeon]
MHKKLFAAFVVAMCALSIVPTTLSADSAKDFDINCPGLYGNKNVQDCEISLFATEKIPSGTDALFSCISARGIAITDRIESIGEKTVLAVSESCADLEKNIKDISNAYKNGAVIISLDGSHLFKKWDSEFGSTSVSDTSDMCGIYRDNIAHTTFCYSVKTMNLSCSMQRIYNWAATMTADTGSKSQHGYHNVVVSEMDLECGNHGWFSFSTLYCLDEFNVNGYDYWIVKYHEESHPKSYWQTGWMSVENEFGSCPFLDGFLLSHGPNSCRSSQPPISVGLSVPNPSISISWNYSGQNVEIINKSIKATGRFYVKHVLPKNSNESKYTYFCKPGAIVKIDHGDSDTAYYSTDVYKVNYWFSILNKTYSVSVSPILYPDR